MTEGNARNPAGSFLAVLAEIKPKLRRCCAAEVRLLSWFRLPESAFKSPPSVPLLRHLRPWLGFLFLLLRLNISRVLVCCAAREESAFLR